MTSEVEHIFVCLSASCLSVLRSVYSDPLSIFKLGCLFIIEFSNLLMFTLIYFQLETCFSLVFLPLFFFRFVQGPFILSIMSRRVESILKPFCILLAAASIGKTHNCGIP